MAKTIYQQNHTPVDWCQLAIPRTTQIFQNIYSLLQIHSQMSKFIVWTNNKYYIILNVGTKKYI